MWKQFDLNGIWDLTYAEGSFLSSPGEYSGLHAHETRSLIRARVPAPIHRVLQENGIIDDPNIGTNSLKCRWVECCYWIYRHTFELPDDVEKAGGAELVFERLEMIGKIYLNGELVGESHNALIPQRFPVTGKLRAGSNLIVVVVETGYFSHAEQDAGKYEPSPVGYPSKRTLLRKPQHQAGWDWHPWLQNVGILGNVRLEYGSGPRWLDTLCRAGLEADLKHGTLDVEVTIHLPETGTEELSVAVDSETLQIHEEKIFNTSGSKTEICRFHFPVDSPRLWWPVGHGDPFRHEIEITLKSSNGVQIQRRKAGFRHVTFDRSPHPEKGHHFILTLNGRRIFCKGANLVPADLYYSEVTTERFRELIDLGLGANYNMLRVWGGGFYLPEEVCDYCDETGMMIWHDFIFACAKYPAEQPQFLADIRDEARRVLRDRAGFASIVCWCGNNELDFFQEISLKHRTDLGWVDHAWFHHDLPCIVREEAPHCFYWPSSPMSEELDTPNSPYSGDQHPWELSLVTPGPLDFRGYRHYEDRFANEGGVLGASTPATLYDFLPEKERCLFSRSWDHHDNLLARINQPSWQMGRGYQAIPFWFGREVRSLSIEEYAVMSGLIQAESLVEYVTNYRRRMFSSASAIFWMHNDSWPTANGWSLVDYYRRKKLCYHPVRHAFAPVIAVPADCGEDCVIFGVNDSPDLWSGTLSCGVFFPGGPGPEKPERTVTIPANCSVELDRIPWREVPAPPAGGEAGIFAQLKTASGRTVSRQRLFRGRFVEWNLVPAPHISAHLEQDELILKSPVFVWRLCLDISGNDRTLADNAFDLLPCREYRIPWPDRPLPERWFCGNDTVARKASP